MTCFSNEANSLLQDCKELLRTTPNKNSYEYPKELLSLQGKKKIFQLHFDPESTKEHQVFILDTCWDTTPLLTSGTSATNESAISYSAEVTQKTVPAVPIPEPTTAIQIKESEGSTPTKEPDECSAEVDAPTTINISQTSTAGALKHKDDDTTPAIEQTSLLEKSKGKKEAGRKSARRALFTEAEDASTTTPQKKAKKED